MNSRIVLALAISAGMALLVTGIFYQVAVRGQGNAVQEVEMREIVVTGQDLAIDAVIAAANIKMEQWPSTKIPEGAFEAIEDTVGRVTIARILVNEPVSGRRLAPAGSGVGLSPKVFPGMRAMAVRVDDVNSVAGFVLPEARVDVLLTGTPVGRGDVGRLTKTILSYVRVLSAGEHLVPDASGRPQRVPVVTLLLFPEQPELLTLARSQGQIQLVLRNSMDEDETKTAGVREPELFSIEFKPAPKPRYGRPLAPKVIRVQAPPRPSQDVEVYRGNAKSVQSFGAGVRQ
jgi:pilus assembly protein CpaB